MNEELESAFTVSEGLSEWATNYIVNCNDSDITNSVDLVLHSVEVTAATRMMRAIWTPQLAQDIAAMTFYNVDSFNEQKERARIKNQRRKDRKIYIKMIEEWAGVEVNKILPVIKHGKR